jgi:hypothetical protein
MTTIDKLDAGVYVQYAKRSELMQEMNQQFRLQNLAQASTIPPLIKMLTLDPQLSEMQLLLGMTSIHTPWAYFAPPKRFNEQQKSIFTFSRIVPSLGSSTDKEDEDEDKQEAMIEAIECENDEEKKEKTVIQECMAQIKKINGWLGFIIGRVGQFIQG